MHVFSQDLVNDFGERTFIRRRGFFFVKLGSLCPEPLSPELGLFLLEGLRVRREDLLLDHDA